MNFCGIGRRNKDSDNCKKPPKSPIIFGKPGNKKPSTSPVTVKEKDDKKSSSGVRVSPISFDNKYKNAVDMLDVKSKESELADKLGLLRVSKIPGKARKLQSYKNKTSNKKGGKRRRRKKRKTRKKRRRKTRKKRRRKKRKTRKKRR